VTHPEMRRYFMLIPEAVQLVLHAAALDDRGHTFVLDMGEQVKVADLARAVIRLSGYVPDRDVAIEFTGVRPGEKLSEELVADEEVAEPSSTPKVLRVRPNGVSRPGAELRLSIAKLDRFAQEGNAEAVLEQLSVLIPEYRSHKPMAVERV
jgi:FlaA1/EpsC-like NDP-sugar epimerase